VFTLVDPRRLLRILSPIDKKSTILVMRFYTIALRVLLVVLAVGFALAYLVLYIVSLDLAASYPALAHLRVPLFLASVVAGIPAAIALGALWLFAALVGSGEGFSPRAVRQLRLMRNCFGVMAAYLLVAFVVTTIALAPGQSPGVFLAWCASEVVAVFLFTLIAVMVELFDNARAIRQELELTV
jgi:hypothetical protein